MANDENQRGFDLIKKLISAGIGAAFMTEESIRNYLGELKLPKDVLNLLLQGAQKSKDELMERVGNEVIKIVQRVDFVKEASRFVEEHKFRITAEVDVVRKSPSAAAGPSASAPSGQSASDHATSAGPSTKHAATGDK